MRADSRDPRAHDARWGRVEGARPPLPAWAPLAWWLASAVVLGVAIIAIVGGPGPLDDPDQGDQRPGFLIDADEARRVPGLALPGRPVGRRPVFVAFARRTPGRKAVRSILRRLPDGFAAVLVLPDDRAAGAQLPIVADPDRRIARAVGMDRPRDGGPPIGYAVIDQEARVRYATIDPTWPDQGFEVGLITKAAR